MKTIWKYELKVMDYQETVMPIGAEILTVQIQKGIPCLWAVVDSSNKKEQRVFVLYGTGHTMIDTKLKFIGTFQFPEHNLVFHLFEKEEN
jgi:hypothetical protein